MPQLSDTSAIHGLIRRARVRIRLQSALEGATTATVLAAASAAISARSSARPSGSMTSVSRGGSIAHRTSPIGCRPRSHSRATSASRRWPATAMA
jgi:hypothetical protein